MTIGELIQPLREAQLLGPADIPIRGLAEHSARVRPGFLFACLRGAKADGYRFLKEAVERGAVAVIVERRVTTLKPVTQVLVPNARLALARMASAFYGHPSRRLRVIGVTGTNGKTTFTYLMQAILSRRRGPAGKTAVIGTIAYRIGRRRLPAPNTTPSALELQQLMGRMVREKCGNLVMEVSSHALEQGRVEGTEFTAAVFTNLTQDHLDYHHTMREYLQAKLKLFRLLDQQASAGPERFAVVNLDDPASRYFLEASPHARTVTYGLQTKAQVRAEQWTLSPEGNTFVARTPWGSARFKLSLLGRVNIQNALAAIATGGALGMTLAQMKDALKRAAPVPGRLERVPFRPGITVLVDYAHTPDALDQLIASARELTKGRVLTVFGCGGNRDRIKRPIMGRIATEKSDLVFITSDNPRTEDPLFIMKEIEKGLTPASRQQKTTRMIVDRREAIEAALAEAKRNDIVLIAGKGHEDTQIIGTQRIHFSDRETVAQIFRVGRKGRR